VETIGRRMSKGMGKRLEELKESVESGQHSPLKLLQDKIDGSAEKYFCDF
jgi:hypothetical protein